MAGGKDLVANGSEGLLVLKIEPISLLTWQNKSYWGLNILFGKETKQEKKKLGKMF